MNQQQTAPPKAPIKECYHGQLPAFTILRRILPQTFTLHVQLLPFYFRFAPTRQLTVYTAVPTHFPQFPQPPRHCLTHLRIQPRHAAPRRAPRASSPPRTRPPRPCSLLPRLPPTCCRRARTFSVGRLPTQPCQPCQLPLWPRSSCSAHRHGCRRRGHGR
eukprot:scaffold66254_cov57-Phaeocystis_antarctica.AAC.1